MRPKLEFNVATVIQNRFTASRVQPNQLPQRKPKFIDVLSILSPHVM